MAAHHDSNRRKPSFECAIENLRPIISSVSGSQVPPDDRVADASQGGRAWNKVCDRPLVRKNVMNAVIPTVTGAHDEGEEGHSTEMPEFGRKGVAPVATGRRSVVVAEFAPL